MVRWALSALIFLLSFGHANAAKYFDYGEYKQLVLRHKTDPGTIIHYNKITGEYELLRYSPESLQQLLQLDTPGFAQNKYFKVVEFKVLKEFTEDDPAILKEETLPLTDIDARNVLYHLMKARDFYAKLDPQNSALNQPALVRVRGSRKYVQETHAGMVEAHNLGVHLPQDPFGRWGQEIWFGAQKQYFDLSWKNFLDAALGGLSYIWAGPASLALVPVSFITAYRGGIDKAKQPSEIYHEAFHWATNTKDLLPAGRYSHPLSENLANYFGSSIEGKPEMKGLRSFEDRRLVVSYSKLKQVKRRKLDLVYDYTTFVPAFLWAFRLQNILTAEETDRLAWTITQTAELTTFPSEVPRLIRSALAGHPKMPAVEALLNTYECSFYNLDERFKIYYVDINGLTLPERPPRCESDKKI